QLLIEHLRARNVHVGVGAPLYAKGEYLVVQDTDKVRDRSILCLIAVVRDRRGKTLLDLQADIKISQAVVELISANRPDPVREPPHGGDRLREELRRFAAEVKKLLKDEGQDSIDVGEFTGPPTPKTSAGPGIQQLLIEQLNGSKVHVKEGAGLYIKGE